MHIRGHVIIWVNADKETFVLVFPYSWELLTGLLHPGVIKADALTSGAWKLAESRRLEEHVSLLLSSCLFHVCLLGHHFGRGRRDKLLAVMLL